MGLFGDLTDVAVAQRLVAFGKHPTPQMVGYWRKGERMPSAPWLAAILQSFPGALDALTRMLRLDDAGGKSVVAKVLADESLIEMAAKHAGGALAKALEKALQNDELAENRQSLREFARLIYRLAEDLKQLGHVDSATEFFQLNNIIRDKADELDKRAHGDGGDNKPLAG